MFRVHDSCLTRLLPAILIAFYENGNLYISNDIWIIMSCGICAYCVSPILVVSIRIMFFFAQHMRDSSIVTQTCGTWYSHLANSNENVFDAQFFFVDKNGYCCEYCWTIVIAKYDCCYVKPLELKLHYVGTYM